MRKTIIFLLAAVLTTIGCGRQQQTNADETQDSDTLVTVVEGDSTVYGLACDGCTDTILVFLPLDKIGADPDTVNILNASRAHRVLGRLLIGHNVGVVRNSSDKTVADVVIDMDNLGNTWCYRVMPTLHQRADMAGRTERQKIEQLPDSIRELLEVSMEYQLQLKSDHTAMTRGTMSNDEEQLIDYPTVKRYRRWHILNGQLLLTEMDIDSVGNFYATSIDTATIMMLSPDTLVLKFRDSVQGYYAGVKQ